MSRYYPTIRGWLALSVSVIGSCFYPAVLPARLVESGVETWLSESVTIGQWVLGGVLVLSSAALCLEAFRRGSRGDKVAACVASVFAIWLAFAFLELFSLRVRPVPV
jgi:hypothetical protein